MISNLNDDQKAVLEICRKFCRRDTCDITINDSVFNELRKQDIVEILAADIFTGIVPKYKTIAKIKMSKNKIFYDFVYRELTSLFCELKDVDYAVTKGLVASLYAYDNVGYRGSSDVDILIDKKDVSKVSRILNMCGFRQGFLDEKGLFVEYQRYQKLFFLTQTHQTAPFYKFTGNQVYPYICVDINFDLFWGESNYNVDVKDFVFNSKLHTFNGIQFKCLDLEKSLVHMCLHNYKENNSLYLLCNNHCFKLRRYLDLVLMMLNDEFNVKKFIKIVEKNNICRYIYYSLFYACSILDYKLDDIYIEWRDDNLMNRYGLKDDEYKIWENSFWERVFDKSYINKIKSGFTDREINKILINEQFMKREASKNDY